MREMHTKLANHKLGALKLFHPSKPNASITEGCFFLFFFWDIKVRMLTYLVKLKRVATNFPQLHHVQRRSYLKHLKVQKETSCLLPYAASSIWNNAQPLASLYGSDRDVRARKSIILHTLKMIFDFILKGFKRILQAPWINSMLPQ